MKLEEVLKTDKFSSQSQKAGLNILYTAWWLKTAVSVELKTIGLTHEQYNVLRILKGKHPQQMCVKDIGSRMIEQNSNVPRIIDRLVLKNFVNRTNSDFDKRETVMSLTVTGIDILRIATQKMNSTLKKLVAITEEEGQLLNELLEKFREKE